MPTEYVVPAPQMWCDLESSDSECSAVLPLPATYYLLPSSSSRRGRSSMFVVVVLTSALKQSQKIFLRRRDTKSAAETARAAGTQSAVSLPLNVFRCTGASYH